MNITQGNYIVFGQQNTQLLPESWKLNGNIFFTLFLSDLEEKMTSAGTTHKGKQQKQAYQSPMCIYLVVFHTQNENTA